MTAPASAAALTNTTGTPEKPAPPPPVELPKIASNIDIQSELEPTQGTGILPPSSSPDVVGAFRFTCSASHLSYDDPIVYPGQPGRSHLHQFFGNSETNAGSNYASLRTTGNSSCGNRLNRSAYWIPAMLNGKGMVVRPDYVGIYYKRRPASDPECQHSARRCVSLPRGLRFVFGYDMLTMSAPATGGGYFNCDGPTAIPGHYPSIEEAAKNCPTGNRLGAIISAPDCWDGTNIDSPDHRSHVAYGSYGEWGYYRCPNTHPSMIPAFTLGAWYTVDTDLDHSGDWGGRLQSWHFSSDAAMRMTAGSTFHADWWGAWDDEVMAMWTSACIDRMLNCSSGDLGNGKQLKPSGPSGWTAVPHLVPVPAQ